MPKKKLRIGVFDGTYSPLHYGHLFGAEWSREEFNLDRVLFVTNANQQHKSGVLGDEDRYEMTVSGVVDNPHFMASRIALECGTHGLSLIMMEAVQKQYPDAELFYMTSSEYLDPEHKWFIGKWVGAKEMFKLSSFIIFPRGDHSTAQIREWAKLVPNARILTTDFPNPNISSTDIRSWIRQGLSIRYTTPTVVRQMIEKKGHYRDDKTPPLKANVPLCDQNLRRICIYGGQFDPINYGDLWRAEWTRQKYDHDRVIFVTSASPPNNRDVVLSAEARHEMVVVAVADNPYFDSSRVDIDRKTTSYTLLTVEEMQKKYGQGVQIDWMVSSEYLNPQHKYYLPNWMGVPKLFEMCRFLVYPANKQEHALGQGWVDAVIKAHPQARVEYMTDAPIPSVTSEMIRKRVTAGKSIWYTTSWSVQQVIAKHLLYKKKRK